MEENTDSKYISELGMLLQKKRSKERSNEVSKILEGNYSLKEKIDLIKQIDSDTAFVFLNDKEIISAEYRELLKKENISDAREARRYRNNLKAPFLRVSFFNFIFSEYKKIRNFDFNEIILKPSLFPPKVRIKKEAGEYFSKYLQKDILTLISCLKLVIKEGWRHLSKKDYNLVYYFSELCKKILAANFFLLNYKEESLLDKFRTLENLFLTCHYHSRFPDIIIYSIDRVMARNPDWEYDPEEINKLVKTVLLDSETRPSLYRFILGLNIVKYRQFINFRKLFMAGDYEVINSYDYECDAPIKNKIKNQLEENLRNLVTHLKQKEEIDKLKKYLPMTDKDNYDFGKLINIYERSSDKKNFRLEVDKENVLLFVQNFYESFLLVYEDFLTDTIELEDVDNEVRVFTLEFFQFEIEKIRFLLKKLANFNYSSPNFPMNRFVSLKLSQKGGTSIEVEMMQQINELLSLSYSIANKLIEISRYHNPIFEENDKMSDTALSPAAVIKRNFAIPFADSLIASHTIINEHTVKGAVDEIVSIFLLLGIFFYDKRIPSLLSKEESIVSNIEKEKDIIYRLATLIELREIKDKYGI